MSHTAKLIISLPPDRATIWKAIIEAMRPDGVCFADHVIAACPMSRETLENSLAAFKAERAIRQFGGKWSSFRVLASAKTAETTEPLAHPVHRNVWNAIRALRVFTRDEVVVLATADLRKTEVLVASEFFDALISAGYLVEHDGVENRVWRLKPSMNSGPQPPMMLQTRFLFDPNLKAAVGHVHTVEVRP